MAFLTANHLAVGGPEQEFQRCFADGLNQSLVSPAAQANIYLNASKRSEMY